MRTAPFWVLVDSQVPAILVELGYLTDTEEEERLRTKGYHHQAAVGLAKGIAAFAERAEASQRPEPKPAPPEQR